MTARDSRWHVPVLLGLTAVLVGAGIGLRDPWPADEPRFVLIARDMALSGQWLLPMLGGDLYAEKPPLYFWLLAAGFTLTDSIRAVFLLPSLLAACGIVWLVYDLGRRLFDRESAFAAAVTLATTIQFVMTTRSAQIDATLALLTTFSLYALLRHLLLGPDWRMYFAGGFAAGLGVITKGVGFLPLLCLAPYAWMRWRGFRSIPGFTGGARWWLAPAGMVLGIAIWLVPMLLATSGNDPALQSYREALLMRQTVGRYADAWHHVQPWYYFIVDVIPGLWLPLSALLFWLVPRWIQELRERDARTLIPLAWTLIVLLFFSLSSGKRGIYIFPALPALALAAVPHLPELYRRPAIKRFSMLLGGALVLLLGSVFVAQVADVPIVTGQLHKLGLSSAMPAALVFGAALVAWLHASLRRPLLAWPATLVCTVVLISLVIFPRIDAERSGRKFIESALADVPSNAHLAFAGYKEQFLLHADRPVTHFGQRRWLDGPQEAYDAARWLNAGPDRLLLLPEDLLEPCFSTSPRRVAGESARQTWVWVRAPAAQECAGKGETTRVLEYRPQTPSGISAPVARNLSSSRASARDTHRHALQ